MVAIEAEHERGDGAVRLVARGHLFQLFAQQLVRHPVEGERHLAVGALDQFQPPLVVLPQPAHEFDRVAHRGRQQQGPHVLGQQPQGEFPHDAPLAVIEGMELIHHDHADVGKVERFAVQQPVEQDFGHHDQDPSLRVLPAVAGDQPHVAGREPPLDGVGLHFAKFLFRQRDQGRGVVSDLARVQSFEQRGLGNQRLARAGRRTDQHPLLAREPGQEGLLLHRVRIVGDLVEVPVGEFIARGGLGPGRSCGLLGLGIHGRILAGRTPGRYRWAARGTAAPVAG